MRNPCKKLIPLVLSLALCFSIATPAHAADDDPTYEVSHDHDLYFIVITEPTCTEPGEGKWECHDEDCNYSEDEEIEPLGHDYGDWIDSMTSGNHRQWCSRCNDMQEGDHTYGEWKVIDETTEKQVCEVCGHEETRDIEVEVKDPSDEDSQDNENEDPATDNGEEEEPIEPGPSDEEPGLGEEEEDNTGDEPENPDPTTDEDETPTVPGNDEEPENPGDNEPAEDEVPSDEPSIPVERPSEPPAVPVTPVQPINPPEPEYPTIVDPPVEEEELDIDDPEPPLAEMPEEEDVELPEEETPLEELPDEESPLVESPQTGYDDEFVESPSREDVELEDIFEDDVPLADVPQTGDNLCIWFYLFIASCCGLIVMTMNYLNEKNKEDEEG